MGPVRDHVTWQGCGPPKCDGNPFFAGELEPCINGQVAMAGAYFGQDVRGIVARLLGEQLPDGDGRWPLETRYPGVMPVEIDAGEGEPSRWYSLRALRVLRWYERADS